MYRLPTNPVAAETDTAMQNHETKESAPGSTAAGTASPRSAMMIVFLVVVIDLLGFGIVIPLLPRIAKSYVTTVFGETAPGAPEATALPEHTQLIGYSASALSLIALVLGVWLLRETRRFGERPPTTRKWFDLSGWKFALGTAAIAPVVLTFFLATVGFGGFESTLSLFLQDAYVLEARQSFLIFAYIGIVLLLTQGFLYRRLAQRLSEVAFMALGMLFMGLGIAILGWVSYQLSASRHEERLSGASGLILGAVMALFSLMQFIFAPIWGRVSDRIGRRPILLLGLAGSVVFYAVFGYACSLPVASAALALTLIFISRVGAGIAGATIATAQAVVADCTPPERRKHGMALIGAAFGIGFTLGPLIGSASLFFSAQSAREFFSLAPSIPGAEQGSLPLLFAGVTVAVIGFAFLTPSAQALISRRTPADRQGEILGVNQSAAAMARILGPAVGIPLYELTASHLLPYAFGAILLFAMLPALILVQRGGGVPPDR
jgi:MFS family permease